MPNFSFKPVQKLQNKKKYVVISSGKILQRNILGVVHITLNGTYYVNVTTEQYTIHPDCWDTKGVKTLYSKYLLNGRRWRYNRDPFYELPARSGFLPFGVGCEVIGDIVENERIKTTFFKIKKVRDGVPDNEEAVAASKFFREHYAEIMKKDDK